MMDRAFGIGVTAGRAQDEPQVAHSACTRNADVQFSGRRASVSEPEDTALGGQGDIMQTAARGVSGGGQRPPFLDRIQESFGSAHDIGKARAHTGAAASEAAASLGAEAYATGQDIAFRGQPDLHTAAHEAAHVIQQQRGVHLQGGLGRAGDIYERHADAVADRVVAGQSAAALLSAGPAGSGRATEAGTTPGESDTELDVAKAARAVPAASGPAPGMVVQRAAPLVPIAIWFGKTIAATTIDAFIDAAIAAILALPTPGALDNVINFLFNLVPGLGEAKKVNEVIFGQVKAGKAANFGRNSDRWAEFENQARRTVDAAKDYATEHQSITRVEYFVDDISDEAREFLHSLSINVVANRSFLN
ncbi:eCIS core domain-containing protein [Haliangium ochraceum]|nr:DUF4157 domain-containing protein [Haliangium ochraceum]